MEKQTIMDRFAGIEEQAANLKTMMIEAGMAVPVEVTSESVETHFGSVYSATGDLDRTAADYADSGATCEADEALSEFDERA